MELEHKIKCFLVDDQLEVLMRLQGLLNKLEIIEVIGSTSIPEEGVQQIINKRPDLVFVDVEMPRMSGFDVVKAIRKENPSIEIVFVTAYDQYAIKAIKEKAFDYLLKPIDMDELKTTIYRFYDLFSNKTRIIVPDSIAAELTERELEVLQLVLKGLSSKEISEKLFISLTTVNTHRQNILIKTGKKSTKELVAGIRIS